MKNDNGSNESKKSRAQQVMEFAASKCELYRNDQRDTYACFVNSDGVQEFWPTISPEFKDALGGWYYHNHSIALAQETLKDACSMLHSLALYSGKLCSVNKRVARLGNSYCLDLCDEKWRQVEVSSTGFKVTTLRDNFFVRSPRMATLSAPENCFDINELWQFIHVPADDKLLILAWIIECYRSDTVYPILEVTGGQGTGKTTLCRMLKMIVDPSQPLLQSRPKSIDDLYISAVRNHLIAIENMSYMNEDMQDACCQLSTGAGFSKRKLHTDTDECSHDVKNPLLLNGIVPLATRSDMISRTIRISLPQIVNGERKAEREIMDDFKQSLPRILGSLLSLFAQVLAKPVTGSDYQLPRLADFALLGESIAQISGKPSGHFLKLLDDNQTRAYETGAEASPFIDAIIQMASRSVSDIVFNGTCGQLLAVIRHQIDFRLTDEFPKSARGVKNCLRRHEAILNNFGISFHFPENRSKEGYKVVIKKQITENSRSSSVTPIRANSELDAGSAHSITNSREATNKS